MAYLGENSEVLNNVCPKTQREILYEITSSVTTHPRKEDSEIDPSVIKFVEEILEISRDPSSYQTVEMIFKRFQKIQELSCDRCSHPLNEEHVCTHCGLVSPVPVLDRQPPRTGEFDGEDRHTADPYLGWTVTRHDFGLGSLFEAVETGDEEKDWLLERMKDLNEKQGEKHLRDVMILMERVVNKLDLPKPVCERIAYLYRKIRKQKLAEKTDIRAVIGALTLIATRETSVPRTEDEVADTSEKLSTSRERDYDYRTVEKQKVTHGSIRRVRKKIERAMNLEVPRAKPEQYIDRFATELGLDREGATRAHRIASIVDTSKVSKSPQLVTAGIIYLANKDKVTQREVANAFSTHQPRISEASSEVSDLLIDAITDSGNSSGTVGG